MLLSSYKEMFKQKCVRCPKSFLAHEFLTSLIHGIYLSKGDLVSKETVCCVGGKVKH